MMNLKNKKSGFTLIEVLMSTAIVGIVLIPVYGLQGQVMERIVKMANSVQRMFAGFDFFLDAQTKLGENEKKLEKKIEDPSLQLVFKVEDISNKSTLGKEFNNLQLEHVEWEWLVEGKKRTDELVAFRFIPPEPEPEKEEKKSPDAKPKESASSAASQKTGASSAQSAAQATPAGAKK